MRILFFTAGVIFCLLACKNRPGTANAKTANIDDVFYDYRVWSEEGSDDVTIRLQYRLEDENGPAVRLQPSQSVTLDNDTLQADSVGYTGVFYEITKPIADFAGPHHISLYSKNEKREEEFSFKPFDLESELPEKIKKQPFQIRFTGFPASPVKVRLVMVDTSFSSSDVNEDVWTENGVLTVDSSLLNNLRSGPITMEIVKEDEKELAHPPKNGGRILLTYRLRRQFEFID